MPSQHEDHIGRLWTQQQAIEQRLSAASTMPMYERPRNMRGATFSRLAEQLAAIVRDRELTADRLAALRFST